MTRNPTLWFEFSVAPAAEDFLDSLARSHSPKHLQGKGQQARLTRGRGKYAPVEFVFEMGERAYSATRREGVQKRSDFDHFMCMF